MDALLTKTESKTTSSVKKQITGAEALLQCLVAEQVKTIFGYPGGAIMPVYDALYHYAHQLDQVRVRHEEGGVVAAGGFGGALGKGVVVV